MSHPLLHPVQALKAAMRATLLADNALALALANAIHEAPPRSQNPPYLVLGDGTMRENDTNDSAGYIIDLDLILITHERGGQQALSLAHKVQTRLESGALTLSEYRLVLLTLRETQTRSDAVKSLTRAVLKWRAFLEPL
jgi:Protein of unknown function (DUF3168)